MNTSAKFPIKVTARHQHMAYLVAAGKPNADIAREMGYTEAWVSSLKASPLFQQQVAQIQRELGSRTIDDIVARIVATGPRAFTRMEQLMDQDDNRSVARDAATWILERNPRIAGIKAAAEHGVRINLDAEAVREMRLALAEAGGEVVDVAPAASGPAELRAVPLGDAIAALDQRDED